MTGAPRKSHGAQSPPMRTPILLAGLALACALPLAGAFDVNDIASSAQAIRDAAQALDANAACEAMLAQNVTTLERGGQTFSCRTDCTSRGSEPAQCTTRSGLGASSPFGFGRSVDAP